MLKFWTPPPVMSFPCDVRCFLIGHACHVCTIWLDRVVVCPLIYRTRFCIQDRHDQSANRLKNNYTKRHKEMTGLPPPVSNLAGYTLASAYMGTVFAGKFCPYKQKNLESKIFQYMDGHFGQEYFAQIAEITLYQMPI